MAAALQTHESSTVQLFVFKTGRVLGVITSGNRQQEVLAAKQAKQHVKRRDTGRDGFVRDMRVVEHIRVAHGQSRRRTGLPDVQIVSMFQPIRASSTVPYCACLLFTFRY